MLLTLTWIQWAVIAGAAVLIGITKTGIPGMGILIVPILAEVLPAKASTGFLLPMLIIGDIFAVIYYRRKGKFRYILKLAPWALAGIIIGYFLLGRVNNEELKPIIGIIVLIMLLVHFIRLFIIRNKDVPIPDNWWFSGIMGITAGITTMMANAAGPIMMIYLTSMKLPKEEYIGTGAWYFIAMNTIKVPFSASLGLITASSLLTNSILIPAIVLGAVLGRIVLKRIPQKAFSVVIQALAALSAVNLVI
ncbi:MAG: sulfite exporter TauE/SafE family protein [Spirochaetia bacterium]